VQQGRAVLRVEQVVKRPTYKSFNDVLEGDNTSPAAIIMPRSWPICCTRPDRFPVARRRRVAIELLAEFLFPRRQAPPVGFGEHFNVVHASASFCFGCSPPTREGLPAAATVAYLCPHHACPSAYSPDRLHCAVSR
jgi:hypothetical protein